MQPPPESACPILANLIKKPPEASGRPRLRGMLRGPQDIQRDIHHAALLHDLIEDTSHTSDDQGVVDSANLGAILVKLPDGDPVRIAQPELANQGIIDHYERWMQTLRIALKEMGVEV